MKTMKSAPSRQRGLSVTGWILMIITAVVFVTMGAKLVPIYLEFNTISTAVQSVLMDPKVGLKSVNEISADIDKRFSINNVDMISYRDLVITKDGGKVEVLADFEVRTNFFKNVDFVVSFDRTYSQNIR
ncbi:MAG: DUF4845 domain-containing protein [Alcanivoracaceae bacterium]|jgi:hypothetical protein|nr:DUF4845 domain-containing protein [Alcanivoracaceae bacterium]